MLNSFNNARRRDSDRSVDDGGTPMFRKGQIGSWREAFTEEHVQVFVMYFRAYHCDLGYDLFS